MLHKLKTPHVYAALLIMLSDEADGYASSIFTDLCRAIVIQMMKSYFLAYMVQGGSALLLKIS